MVLMPALVEQASDGRAVLSSPHFPTFALGPECPQPMESD